MGTGRTVVAALVTLMAALAAGPATARADVTWLCNPAIATADDPCEAPLDTTAIAPDGTATGTTTPARPAAARRPVDCFYVYPTVSNQPGPNATKAKDPEVRAVAQFQASRFSPGCRMFAPVYRQVTLSGVLAIGVPATAEVAYADVAEAWKQYLAQDNGGRGVVLIGHSQGAIMLRALIRREIDQDPAARERLVGAFLLGGNVTTKAGATTGGDFQAVPTCSQRGEDGCVTAFSTSSIDPGPVSFFGNTDQDVTGLGLGLPRGAGYQVACTDPGTLRGSTAAVPVALPTAPFPPGLINAGIAATANGPLPTAETTWVNAYRYQGGCTTVNGSTQYRFEPVDGSRRFNESPPTWGTHLLDFNLGADRLRAIAGQQSRTWLGDRLAFSRPRANRRVRTVTTTATLPGAGTLTITAAGRTKKRVVRVEAPSRVRVTLRPSARGSRKLRRRGSLRATARLVYRPAGAGTITRSLPLRFRAATRR